MMPNQVSIIKKTVIASSIMAIVISSGCATPQYTSQHVDDASLKKAGNEITSANNWVPRYLSDEEAEKKSYRNLWQVITWGHKGLSTAC